MNLMEGSKTEKVNTLLFNLKQKSLILIGKLIRTKEPEVEVIVVSHKLKKCLTTLDLISLGVGSCVGTGMYLVTGMVAHKYAGPGVVISFVIAALASLFSGVCYAEFGVRVPFTSGSAYMYSYVTVGEFIAFIIGWNMILEYLIGSAAGACAISACLNTLVSNSITSATESIFGRLVGHVPDLLAALITILMTILLVAGVKKSLMFNNILNLVNFSIWLIVMLISLYFISFKNWTDFGRFLPFGWSGVLKGAATCFYAFIGFDIIATTGEEAEDPKKSIPTAIISSLLLTLIAYISSSLILTLVVPYVYINMNSALVEMFVYVKAYYLKDLIAIAALAGLIVSMLGSMFPMPRVVYSMAKDGLIFERFSAIWSPTGTPMIATVFFGGLTTIVSLLVSLEVLVEMMSIGTLMAYTLVSTCVLLLRYQPNHTNLIDLLPETVRSACATPNKETRSPFPSVPNFTNNPFVPNFEQRVSSKRITRYDSSDSEDTNTDPNCFRQDSKDDEFLVPGAAGFYYGSVPYQHGGSSGKSSNLQIYYQKLCMYFFPHGWKVNGPATDETGLFVVKLMGLFFIFVIIFDTILVWFLDSLDIGNRITTAIFVISLIAIIACIFTIARQPQIRSGLKFKAPGVPFVPAIAIIINVYLILRLSVLTLIRFTIWMSAGFAMYFGYGIKNSLLEIPKESNDIKKNQSHQIELTIPKDIIKQKLGDNLNSENKTYKIVNEDKLNSEIKSTWQSFE